MSPESQPAAAADDSLPVAASDIPLKIEPEPSASKSADDGSNDQPVVVKKVKKQVAFNQADEMDAAKREADRQGNNAENDTGAASNSVEDQISTGTGRRSSRRTSSRRKLSLRWKRT